MLRRIGYTLAQTWRQRRALGRLYAVGDGAVTRVLELDPARLKAQGVAGLVLDFDGVLAAHGESTPLPAVEPWLDACVEEFGAARVFLLSNKPTPQRLTYFERRYPGLRMVAHVRKKPYPDGLAQISARSGLAPAALALVDDRLLTGGLAACLAGTRFIYVTQAYFNLRRRPLSELFFISLRGAERLLVRGLNQLP